MHAHLPHVVTHLVNIAQERLKTEHSGPFWTARSRNSLCRSDIQPNIAYRVCQYGARC